MTGHFVRNGNWPSARPHAGPSQAGAGRFTRRSLLALACGAAAIPFLDSVGEGALEPRPRRLILVYTANGTYPQQWFPSNVRGETDFDLGPIHAPLASYKDNLVLVKGVHNEVATNPENNGGPHQRGIGGLFTGQMLQQGEFKDGCGKSAGWADGMSVDQRVAQVVGRDTPFASLELGIRTQEDDVQGRISYAGPGAPLPPIHSPRAVWERLFANGAASGSASRRQAITDAVHAQFSSLRHRVSAADRDKFDAHLHLVDDLERRLEQADSPELTACGLVPEQPPEQNANAEELMPAISRAQIDLLAVAFACDLTRVASLQYSTGFNRLRYPWLESLKEGHTLSHSGASNVEAWEELGRRQQWHSGEIAYLLDRLSEIPEGEGSVLDNTLVLWGTEVSQGNSHSHLDVPFLLAGGKSVGLRGGQYLQLEGRSHGELLLSILHMFGVTDAHFGHPDHGDGLLEQLLS